MTVLGVVVSRLERCKDPSFLGGLVGGLDLEGLEFIFKDSRELNDFKLSREGVDIVSSLSFVSVHSPWTEKSFSGKDVERLQQVSELVGAGNVVIHPRQIAPGAWASLGFPVSTENRVKERYYEHVLENNPRVGLVLDVAHAYRVSRGETKRIIEKHGEKIREVHLSARASGEDHQPFKEASSQFLESIEDIKKLSCPLILETSTVFDAGKEEIKEEIGLVKRWLSW